MDSISSKSYRQSDRPILAGSEFHPITGRMQDSIRFLMLSQESLKKGKRTDAVRQMDNAIELHKDPGYLYIYGLLLLAQRRLEEALSVIESLEKPFTFPHVKEAALHLWKARTLDMLDRRERALEIYRYLDSDANLPPQMQKVVRKAIRRPFSYRRMPKSFDYGVMGPLLF